MASTQPPSAWDGTLTIWIDAISIDQGDFVEKTAQIKMTMEIYSQASYIIIWLGKRFEPSGEDIIRGVKLLYKICPAIDGIESAEECMEIADRVINGEGENPDQNS